MIIEVQLIYLSNWYCPRILEKSKYNVCPKGNYRPFNLPSVPRKIVKQVIQFVSTQSNISIRQNELKCYMQHQLNFLSELVTLHYDPVQVSFKEGLAEFNGAHSQVKLHGIVCISLQHMKNFSNALSLVLMVSQLKLL